MNLKSLLTVLVIINSANIVVAIVSTFRSEVGRETESIEILVLYCLSPLWLTAVDIILRRDFLLCNISVSVVCVLCNDTVYEFLHKLSLLVIVVSVLSSFLECHILEVVLAILVDGSRNNVSVEVEVVLCEANDLIVGRLSLLTDATSTLSNASHLAIVVVEILLYAHVLVFNRAHSIAIPCLLNEEASVYNLWNETTLSICSTLCSGDTSNFLRKASDVSVCLCCEVPSIYVCSSNCVYHLSVRRNEAAEVHSVCHRSSSSNHWLCRELKSIVDLPE